MGCSRCFCAALLLLLALLAVPQVSRAGSSKYACDYSNRLCQWNASYGFGATVLGDKAFFQGGLYSNDASTPINGSSMEVLDLRTMSPYVIQVQYNPALNSTRYKHQLVAWRDMVLAVGGQVDNADGKSRSVVNVIGLDLNERSWLLIKQFKTGKNIEFAFDAAVVAGDYLLLAFQKIDPEDPGREYLRLDLTTGSVEFNYALFKGVGMVDWPLIGIMSLTGSGDFPHLVLQAKRQMPNTSQDSLGWFVVDGDAPRGPLSCKARTRLVKLPGGAGGKVLALSILQVLGKPKLVMLATTNATFKGSQRPQNVTTLSLLDITAPKTASSTGSVSLELTHLLLGPPPSVQLDALQAVDLPLFGNRAVAAKDVTALPYVGRMDLIGEIDQSNANIQATPSGIVVRGSGRADQSCQPGATWQPFVVKVDLDRPGPLAVTALSNYTWCATRSEQQTAAKIVNDAAELATNTQLFRVDSQAGPVLMTLNAQRRTNPGGQLLYLDEKAPLMGAYINIRNSTVSNFTISIPGSYGFPIGVSSCMTALQGRPLYVETGGTRFDAKAAKNEMPERLLTMDVSPDLKQHALAAAAGGDVLPPRAQAALACTPDGKVFLFGGLSIGGYKVAVGGVSGTRWVPNNDMYSFKLDSSSKKGAGASVRKTGELTEASVQPVPRSGHAMAYLPPAVVSKLGMQQGAVVMYGGSDVAEVNLNEYLSLDNDTAAAAKLRNSSWDRSTWLFDVGGAKWVELKPAGGSQAPPGLMYHSMTAMGPQVMVFGGQAFNRSSSVVRLSSDLYVLDLSEAVPRWRRAEVGNINVQGAYQLAWPNSGIAAMPESGAVALKHRSGVSLAAIPQSLKFAGDGRQTLASWGLNTLNLTAGDWVRLAPSQPQLILDQPLLLGGDIIVTGQTQQPAAAAVSQPRGAAAGGSGRHLMQSVASSEKLQLTCGPNTTTAVAIKSAGAQLSKFIISGCNGTAVDIQVDATGAFTSPAQLSNITITRNTGTLGSALWLGPAAAASLQDVTVTGNAATNTTVYAGERSSLSLINCTITNNRGTAVLFAGSSLNVRQSSFRDNAAAAPTVTPKSLTGPKADRSGGALRLLCSQLGPGGYSNVAFISNTAFSNNTGVHGGAVHCGAGATLTLVNVSFGGNRAVDGGAMFADRDSCVADMVNSTFSRNLAQQRGGALKMHNPSCQTVRWSGCQFVNNTAADGGALFLTELSTRTITGSRSVFSGNRAIKREAQLPSSSGGEGGAIYLGLWASQVTLDHSSFINNAASVHGGALHALAIDSSQIRLVNVNASGNAANLVLNTSLSGAEVVARRLRSEGGALHVSGSLIHVRLQDSSMDNNQAGRGGAISFNSEAGSLLLSNTSFRSNSAWTAGGAVSVTERKSVFITASNFTNNIASWKELAAGGGLYCFLCNSVSINSSLFEGNRAAYGGGAAVLQPWQPSVIADTGFFNNTALPDPSSPLQTAAQRRRALLAISAADQQHQQLFSGSAAVDPQKLGGQAAAAAILGPIGANVTGDNGFYTGGGGLYVSLSSAVTINNSAFLQNTAYNGGGLLARTDACKDIPGASSAQCRLVLSRVSVRNNTANAGGGMLLTNISSSVVQLMDCSQGSSVSHSTKACFEAPNALSTQLEGEGHRGRSLLQQSGPDGLNTATTGYGNMLLTTAATLQCQKMVNGSSGMVYIPDDCEVPIRAAAYAPIMRSFRLIDGLGEPIRDGIYDARMGMGATMVQTGAGPVYQLLGNTTQAQNGSADFMGLTVNGKPGNNFTLRFKTQNGIVVTRDVVLRNCTAGEVTAIQNVGTEVASGCVSCYSPTYSLNPYANKCSQCLALNASSWAVCNLAALVPADGFYQSHPRSPLLVRCINSLACRRNESAQQQMALWAYSNSEKSVDNINAHLPLLQRYMDLMCTTGYMGPLCGACQSAYGHSGHACVRCLRPWANALLYFLVCCFMFLIPAVQMLMHSKNVHERTLQLEEANKKDMHPWAHSTSMERRPGAAAAGGRRLEQMPTVKEVVPSSPTTSDDDAAENKDGVHAGAASGAARGVADAPEGATAAGSPWDVVLQSSDNDVQSEASGASRRSPFSFPGAAAAAAAAASRDGSAASLGPHMSPGADHELLQQPGVRSQSTSLFDRLFGVESFEEQEPRHWGVPYSMKYRGSFAAPTASTSTAAGERLPSDITTGSIVSRTGSPAPVVAAAAGGAVAAAAGPVVLPHMPSRRVHRRSFKFWHTDVLSMLVNYMQLLGLLRLVRIDWTQRLAQLLVYLDFTSGATTWASIECSLSETELKRSIKRSIVLLLWPVGALLVLCGYWACYVGVRRRSLELARVRRYLFSHIIMSIVIMLYFLYTPTTREIVSLFSCQEVDDPSSLPPEIKAGGPESQAYQTALKALPNTSPNVWRGYWTSDTLVVCGSPQHLGLAIGLGIPGLLLFAVGLPVALWVVLRRNSSVVPQTGRSKLEDPEVELKYGLMYDKYRYSCYYWECVILLENFMLTLLLVMLQTYTATLQVLVAMAVIFIEAVLHITFQPYACRMLDTLRRLSVYGLMSTLFMLMLVSLSEMQSQARLVVACMVIVLFINVAVIAIHLWACALEVKRWIIFIMGKEEGSSLTWQDLEAFVRAKMLHLRGAVCCGAKQPPQAAAGGATRTGAPQEQAVGSVSVVNPTPGGAKRTGNVVVLNPSKAADPHERDATANV